MKRELKLFKIRKKTPAHTRNTIEEEGAVNINTLYKGNEFMLHWTETRELLSLK